VLNISTDKTLEIPILAASPGEMPSSRSLLKKSLE
jgi:hypothetical protein